MNVVAGVLIYFLSEDVFEIFELALMWAVFHVFYGFLFKMHTNPVVMSSQGGNPVLSYYFTRFTVGLITAGFTGVTLHYIASWFF